MAVRDIDHHPAYRGNRLSSDRKIPPVSTGLRAMKLDYIHVALGVSAQQGFGVIARKSGELGISFLLSTDNSRIC
jgi:hypothetical protein